MAGQELGISMKTTTDVPQAMDKAKGAVQGFDKQLVDIGNKFKNSFKDIFLGFTAPMVIINSLMGMISDKIAEAKRSAQEGFDLIASGETKFASSEQKKLANFLKIKAAIEKEKKDVEEGMIEMTRQFLETDQGKKFLEEDARKRGLRRQDNPNVAVHYESSRKAALEYFLNSEEGKKFKPLFEDKEAGRKEGTFKGPEGLSNVIGVGPNPVLDNLTRQLDIQEQILEYIKETRPRLGSSDIDFTKNPIDIRTVS